MTVTVYYFFTIITSQRLLNKDRKIKNEDVFAEKAVIDPSALLLKFKRNCFHRLSKKSHDFYTYLFVKEITLKLKVKSMLY